MLNYKKVIETDQIRLRPIKEDDFEEMKELTKNPEVWTFFTSNLSNKEELLKWIRAAIKSTDNKERLAFTIIDKRNNKIVGSTSLGNYSERDKRIEIGWTWLTEKAQGTGLNQMVKLCLLKYCFEELNLERVESKTDVLNIAAKKGLEKSGFTKEGVLRSHTLLANGRRRDTIYYGFLKNEWNHNSNQRKQERKPLNQQHRFPPPETCDSRDRGAKCQILNLLINSLHLGRNFHHHQRKKE